MDKMKSAKKDKAQRSDYVRDIGKLRKKLEAQQLLLHSLWQASSGKEVDTPNYTLAQHSCYFTALVILDIADIRMHKFLTFFSVFIASFDTLLHCSASSLSFCSVAVAMALCSCSSESTTASGAQSSACTIITKVKSVWVLSPCFITWPYLNSLPDFLITILKRGDYLLVSQEIAVFWTPFCLLSGINSTQIKIVPGIVISQQFVGLRAPVSFTQRSILYWMDTKTNLLYKECPHLGESLKWPVKN